MKDKINSTLPTLRAGLRAALFLLKLTTLFVLALIGWKIFSGKVPPAVAYALSFVFALLGGFVVDGVLDKILPLAMTRASTTDKNERRFKIAITALSLVLLVISGTLSWWAMPELSEVAIGKDAPKTDSTLAEIQEFRAGFLAEVQGKDIELAEAKRTERARVRDAEKRGRALVAAAIASGPDRWQELHREKNTWFAKQGGDIRRYRQRIADAEAKAAALVEKERSLAETIRAEKAGIESSRGAAIDSISTAFTGIAVAQAQRHERRLANMTNVLLICDVAWMFLALFLSWLIGLVDGHEFRAENRNMFGVLFEVADDREQGALAEIEWRLKRKPKKQPTVPTVPATPTPAPVNAPAPGAPADDVAKLEAERLARIVAEQAEQLRLIAEQVAEQKAKQERNRAEQKAEQIAANPVSNSVSGAEQKAEQSGTTTEQVSGTGAEQIVVKIVRQDGKPVVKHQGRDGVKYYTLSEVQSQKSTYRKRIETAKSETSKATNRQNYELFCIYEAELQRHI